MSSINPPSNSNLISPLSKPGQYQRRRTISPDVSRKLFDTSSAAAPTTSVKLEINDEYLFKIYGKDFLHPKPDENSIDFFALREQLLLIEKKFQNLNTFDRATLKIHQDTIRTIIHSASSLQTKVIELGLIYYYLDRDGNIPNFDSSALAHRADEILDELQFLKTSHTEVANEHKVPSGKTHYLLRAFARMVLSSEQKFNRGGAYALRSLLKNSNYKIALHLKPEHLNHILVVLEHLLSKPQIATLLETSTSVHPDLEELIRIDLKLHPETPITSQFVMLDCVMALFFDIRQSTHGNCYAIGALIYTIENTTYKFLSLLISYLKTGHFTMDENTIPISPLVKNRLLSEPDLHAPFSSEQALSLTPFFTITSTLNVGIGENIQGNSLHQILSSLLKTQNQEALFPFAAQLYCSFKHNSLVHMMLSLIEFHNCNTMENKNDFVQWIRRTTYGINSSNYGPGAPRDLKKENEFRVAFQKLIKQKIWFVNSYESNVTIEGNHLHYGPSYARDPILNFEGSLQDLANAFKKGQRIHYLHNGHFVPLKTMTQLQQALGRLSQDAAASLKSENKDCSELAKAYQTHYLDDGFKQKLSRLQENKIKLPGIKSQHLSKIDLLIFAETGGYEELVLEELFKKKPSFEKFSFARPSEFLTSLSRVFNAIDRSTHLNAIHYLAECNGHAFLLSVSNCAFLLESNHQKMMELKVSSPLAKLLQSSLPSSIATGIIKAYAADNQQFEKKILEDMQSYHSRSSCTYASFLRFFENKISQRDRPFFYKIVNEWYLKKELSQDVLTKIFQDLGWPVERVKEVQGFLEAKFKHQPQAPFVYARFLRKSAIRLNLENHELVKIEATLTKHLELPLSFDIADLNYQVQEVENPVHKRLVLRIDFSTLQLGFFNRGKTEYLATTKSPDEFFLFYPK